jgi:acetyltransferase-like isoleucine patch superfamily enzyme
MSLRRTIKAGTFAFCLLLTAVPVALAWVEKRVWNGQGLFALFSQLLAVVPGAPGVQLRAAFYFATLDRCHWEVHIGFGSLFVHRGAELGRHVSTGAYCVIGHATIGDGVRLASRVSIPSGKRQHLDERGALSAATHFDRVQVGPDCWVGEGAILLADVGPRSIVSAGAVVTHPLPGGCLAGGNPAKVLRQLGDDQPRER